MVKNLDLPTDGPVEIGPAWTGRLAEWLERMRRYDPDGDATAPFQTWSFPTRELLEEFLEDVQIHDEDLVRHLLRCLLWSSGTFTQDKEALWWRMQTVKYATEDDRADATARLRNFLRSEYGRRIVRRQPAQPGVRWILDLAPWRPRLALTVIDAYLAEFAFHLPDGRLEGLYDGREVISARYMRPRSIESGLEALRDVTPRELEMLACTLYREMGYTCELTKQTRDGGRDVVAIRESMGRREQRLVECKHYGGTVGVEPVRALYGVLQADRASSSVLITTSQFSPDAIAFAERVQVVELIDGTALVRLLTEHFGTDWFSNLDVLISRSRRKEIGSSDGPATNTV